MLRPNSPLLPLYGKHFIGRRITVAQQALAEVRYGAIAGGWESDGSRPSNVSCAEAASCPSTTRPTWAYARLRHQCRALGHPLHQKQHLGDLWIAATAIRWQLPLVAHDAGFLDCPNVQLLTELPALRRDREQGDWNGSRQPLKIKIR